MNDRLANMAEGVVLPSVERLRQLQLALNAGDLFGPLKAAEEAMNASLEVLSIAEAALEQAGDRLEERAQVLAAGLATTLVSAQSQFLPKLNDRRLAVLITKQLLLMAELLQKGSAPGVEYPFWREQEGYDPRRLVGNLVEMCDGQNLVSFALVARDMAVALADISAIRYHQLNLMTPFSQSLMVGAIIGENNQSRRADACYFGQDLTSQLLEVAKRSRFAPMMSWAFVERSEGL